MRRGMVLIGLNLLPKRTALLFLKITSQISTKNNEKNSILLQNMRSLSKNFDEFKIFQESEKQAIAICLTETWLKPTDNKQIFNLANYSSLFSSGKKRGGGVGIFVNCAANAKLLAKLEKVSIQAISVLINYRGTEKVITCVYIPPNCTNEATFSTLGSYLDEIVLKPNTKHIHCGDLNINFFTKEKNMTS